MEGRQKEIYDDIIRRRGPKNPLTASQKKHLKHVAKKRVRSENRKAKQLKEQQESGKLIEESHNGGDYSVEYTNKAADWLITEILDRVNSEKGFLLFFRGRREKYVDLLLKWSPDCPRDNRFNFYKGLLEKYWENKEDEAGLKEYAKSFLESSGK